MPATCIGVERVGELRVAYGLGAGGGNAEKLRVVYSDGDFSREDFQIWNAISIWPS
jgi:hypothetical protein|tara:strand:+ start:319 stop:486 length:168 start_codon:yes stop_codon:yes gene_type:complete